MSAYVETLSALKSQKEIRDYATSAPSASALPNESGIESAALEGSIDQKKLAESLVNIITLKQQEVVEDWRKTNIEDEQWWYLRGFLKGLQWLEDQLNRKIEGQ